MSYFNHNLFPPIITSVTLILFILLQPKVSALLLSPIRQNRIQTFFQHTANTKTIDAKRYWETREFYSPGHFTFQQTGIPMKEISSSVKKIGIEFNEKQYFHPFLIYHSQRWTSIEFLVQAEIPNESDKQQGELLSLPQPLHLQHILSKMPNIQKCIIENSSTLLCSSDDSQMILFFLKSIEEMKQSNGFLDYAREDVKELVSDKLWLSISFIKLD